VKTEIRTTNRSVNARTQALGALSITIQDGGKEHELKPISILDRNITVDKNKEIYLAPDEKRQLNFRLRNHKWHETALVRQAEDTSLVLSLIEKERPTADSRISRRWTTSNLHPITARIQNDLAAGQWATCSVENISIGGAKLTTSIDHLFLEGQHGEVEIDYPLQAENSQQKFEVSRVQRKADYQELHIRFATITDSHIQSISEHLIRFQLENKISELELDLSRTTWPSERISTNTKKIGNKIEVCAIIHEEVLCRLDAELGTTSIDIQNMSFDHRWTEENQLLSMLDPLFGELETIDALDELHIVGNYQFLEKLGFSTGEGDSDRWILKTQDIGVSNAIYTSTGEKNRSFRNYLSPSKDKNKAKVSWDDYGLVYDKMCEVNSSYKQLLEGYNHWLNSLNLDIAHAIDIGAGTGNFVLETSKSLPNTDIVHIDQDIIMNLFAQNKYRAKNVNNVRIRTTQIESASFEKSSIDLATSVHALYTLKDPQLALSRIYNWLKPEGYFYIVDIGRTIDTNEWSKHIFLETTRSRGLFSTAKYFWDARAAIKANKEIEATQNKGEYWTKSHEQFRDALENAGFLIEHSEITYRGNSDLAICRKN